MREKPLRGSGSFLLSAPRYMKHLTVLCIAAGLASAEAQSPFQSSSDFAKYAMKLREDSILNLEPQVIVPTNSGNRGLYPWKLGIVTTIFWVGEAATANNPVHNMSSSWDKYWHSTFGGYDNPNPEARVPLQGGGTIPKAFVPQGNPFYFALPYNDVSQGRHKAEARSVIPWFSRVFEEEGKSVLRDRWIAIKKGNRVCYAQWSDCGPFSTDSWQYVFGSARPAPNINKGAGLDVSPAVRDFLRLGSTDTVDWKFVEYGDVPYGPWALYGENNAFVLDARRNQTRVARADKSEKPAAATKGKNSDLELPTKDDDGPVVITK
jgi:hypothetical protein